MRVRRGGEGATTKRKITSKGELPTKTGISGKRTAERYSSRAFWTQGDLMLQCAFCRRVVLALIGSAGILGAGIRAVSQQPAVKPARPKVGLVFEGGGALGFAHIGVIEYLEAHHIPVDYVAGTSMGGLVGGLYAAGNSPDEIKQFVG